MKRAKERGRGGGGEAIWWLVYEEESKYDRLCNKNDKTFLLLILITEFNKTSKTTY